MTVKYTIETKTYKVPERLTFSTIQNISLSRYVKHINNMEPKKKINWLKIWQMIRDILVGILTADAIRDKI